MLKKEREAREMEISKRIIEIENQRKTKELEDARNIQLSLLPQYVNNIQNYSTCFNMKTATEVGGDYFDYNISDDGEITIVIGDATDHGMKAGMMVSIVKSLFLTHVENTEIKDFLIKCSRTIKKMNLKNLFMALMLVKIKDNKLTVSSAGIPPFLIYRNKTKKIEEYKIKGMPLGVVDSFPYETIETELFSGDTVLLMTDGFPELFNNDRESFGYDRLKKVFLDNINLSVNEIIDKLFSAGDEWRGESKQNDDITFVAFRLN
jgi:serine phosphatase RsbU (regulator of sigma subunit)